MGARLPARFRLGVGVGHPGAVSRYRSPLQTMATYLDVLDAGGVPEDRRLLAALGPRALRLAVERAPGTHPYPVVPGYTHYARHILGSEPLLAPRPQAGASPDPATARAIGRAFV